MTRSATARASPPEGNVLKTLGHLVRKDAGGPPVFRMSSAVLDRHRDRVSPDGIKTDNFEKNPVLLWNHDDGEPAIGTCRVFREGDEWLMEPSFDELDALSKTVAAKVKAGTLRTCSIRFRCFSEDFEFNAEGGLDYSEVELLEVSIVNIPANPEAYRVKNNDKKKDSTPPPPEEETAAKALEQADLDAIQAAVAAAIAPVLEKLDALETALAGGASTSVEGEAEPVDEEPEDEEAKGDDDTMEMSEEEAEEMKSFFAPKPTPKKKK